MIQREKELIILTVMALDDANPDIGMAPSISTFARDHLECPFGASDLKICIDLAYNKRTWRNK